MNGERRDYTPTGQIVSSRDSPHGLRKRETFRTAKEAEAHAKRLADEIKAEGEAALAITGNTRLAALRLLQSFPTRQEQDERYYWNVG